MNDWYLVLGIFWALEFVGVVFPLDYKCLLGVELFIVVNVLGLWFCCWIENRWWILDAYCFILHWGFDFFFLSVRPSVTQISTGFDFTGIFLFYWISFLCLYCVCSPTPYWFDKIGESNENFLVEHSGYVLCLLEIFRRGIVPPEIDVWIISSWSEVILIANPIEPFAHLEMVFGCSSC